MSLLTLIFTYIIVWWVVIFMVLPWGNKQPKFPEKGMAYGAPHNPNIKKKMIATTIISFLILGMIYALIEMNIVDIRGAANEMDARIYGNNSINNE